MIIQSGNIGMNSGRRYNQKQLNYSALTVWNNNTRSQYGVMGDAAAEYLGEKPAETGYMNAAKALLEKNSEGEENKNSELSVQESLEKAKQNIEDAYNVGKTNKVSKTSSAGSGMTTDKINAMRRQCLDYLLYLLFGKKMEVPSQSYFEGEDATADMGQELTDLTGTDYESLPEDQAIGGQVYNSFYYSESETTSFTTSGTVVTGDGQEISFNLSLTMSRSFTTHSSTMINFGAAKYCDPLVINLDCDAADVTDQKFYFDLNADGHEEYISQLGYGSGYLAWDKNGDGAINDGSELFGTESGNGFADLAHFDIDGNGWIDEADEIFEKLMIWRMDESGQSTLCGLGAAGVGAIYLGSQETEFAMKDINNNVKAMVRSTGFFLYENAGVGSIQQLDMAT